LTNIIQTIAAHLLISLSFLRDVSTCRSYGIDGRRRLSGEEEVGERRSRERSSMKRRSKKEEEEKEKEEERGGTWEGEG